MVILQKYTEFCCFSGGSDWGERRKRTEGRRRKKRDSGKDEREGANKSHTETHIEMHADTHTHTYLKKREEFVEQIFVFKDSLIDAANTCKYNDNMLMTNQIKHWQR